MADKTVLVGLLATMALLGGATHENTNAMPRVVFKEQGTVITAHEVLHVKVDIDLNVMKEPCDRLEKVLLTPYVPRLKFITGWGDDPVPAPVYRGEYGNEIYEIVKAAVDETCQMANNLDQMINVRTQYNDEEVLGETDEIHEDHKVNINLLNMDNLRRRKRQLDAVADVVNFGFSVYNEYQIRQLSTRIDHFDAAVSKTIVAVRQEHSRVNQLSENLQHISRATKFLVKFLKDIDTSERTFDYLTGVFMQTQILRNHINRFVTGLDQVANGKLPLEFMTPDATQQIWQDIRSRKGGERALLKAPLDLYRLPATALINRNARLRILVHVPVEVETFKLYRHVPVPIAIPGNATAAVLARQKDGKDLLAINGDGTLHIELNPSILEQDCWRLRATHVCDHMAVYNKDTAQTCLGGLYMGQRDAIQRYCRVTISHEEWQVEHLGRNRYLIYVRDRTSLQSRCSNGTTGARVIHGYQEVEVVQGCELYSDRFVIRPAATHDLHETIHFPVPWNITALTLGKDSDALHHAEEELRRVHAPLPDTVGELLDEAQHELDAAVNTGLTSMEIALVAVSVLLAGLSITACGYLMWRYRRTRRRVDIEAPAAAGSNMAAMEARLAAT